MRKEQEEVFWQTIRQFKKIGILQHVMIIGSWAEYFIRCFLKQILFLIFELEMLIFLSKYKYSKRKKSM